MNDRDVRRTIRGIDMKSTQRSAKLRSTGGIGLQYAAGRRQVLRGGLAMASALFLRRLEAAPALSDRPLVILVDSSAEMPMTQVINGNVVGGVHFDIGSALAAKLHTQVSFKLLPRRRLMGALQDGEADLMCGFDPAWLSGDVRWSAPFLDNSDLLIARADAPRPIRIDDVADVPIGTIGGFVYPALELRLGSHFKRDDAATLTANLEKLRLGRIAYAVVNRRILVYLQHVGDFKLAIHPPLVLDRRLNRCALSNRSALSLEQLDQAIDALTREGVWDQIDGKYR